MDLRAQKTLAAKVLNCSPKRVLFATDKLATIKDALTRADIRDLINSGTIEKLQSKNQSHVRARHNATQKSRGLRKGPGSRKGSANARFPQKLAWMRKTRLQRAFAAELKASGKISTENYRSLYLKIKSNNFKDKQALKLYLNENSLFTK